MASDNVEKLVINWLETVIGHGWFVYGDVPEVMPEAFLLVDRTGGPRESMALDQAEILIEVYHKTSRVVASDKAQEVADNIVKLLKYHNTTRAKINSIVKLDDTINQYFRYQVYCDIYCRR